MTFKEFDLLAYLTLKSNFDMEHVNFGNQDLWFYLPFGLHNILHAAFCSK